MRMAVGTGGIMTIDGGENMVAEEECGEALQLEQKGGDQPLEILLLLPGEVKVGEEGEDDGETTMMIIRMAGIVVIGGDVVIAIEKLEEHAAMKKKQHRE